MRFLQRLNIFKVKRAEEREILKVHKTWPLNIWMMFLASMIKSTNLGYAWRRTSIPVPSDRLDSIQLKFPKTTQWSD